MYLAAGLGAGHRHPSYIHYPYIHYRQSFGVDGAFSHSHAIAFSHAGAFA
jgi:hypothetical protein